MTTEYRKKENEIAINIATRREYYGKLSYWKGQEKKSKEYIVKYDDIINKLTKEIEGGK